MTPDVWAVIQRHLDVDGRDFCRSRAICKAAREGAHLLGSGVSFDSSSFGWVRGFCFLFCDGTDPRLIRGGDVADYSEKLEAMRKLPSLQFIRWAHQDKSAYSDTADAVMALAKERGCICHVVKAWLAGGDGGAQHWCETRLDDDNCAMLQKPLEEANRFEDVQFFGAHVLLKRPDPRRKPVT